ncbi:MAG: hypothetical protein A2Y76_05225 [Planctomycetes bacterium RBG_13_60_9]|nr:MAG: hypothetical protein A2Y76_05225 [Planctomycetes bacterium RBG_13_60_9]
MGLHNTKRNLRNCTKSQDARNQRPQEGRSSQYIGVCWHKDEQKWYARIQREGGQRNIGLFDRERQAAKARDGVAVALHGEYAHLNFPRRYRRKLLLAKLKQRLATLWTSLRKATGLGP